MTSSAVSSGMSWHRRRKGRSRRKRRSCSSQGVEGAEAAKKKPAGNSSRAIDWESVSLWNPQWKVEAPDFERTPVKLAEFHGRTNVLLMHPFTKDKPSALERKVRIGAGQDEQAQLLRGVTRSGRLGTAGEGGR